MVTVQQSKFIIGKGYKVKPGQKLCSSCRNILLKIQEESESSDESETDEVESSDIGQVSELDKNEAIAQLNASFTHVGCSPLKLHALSEHSKKSYGKEKLEKFEENVKKKIEKALKVEFPAEENQSLKTVEQKPSDMDKLVEIMKKELLLTSKKKEIQILKIPASLMWTRKKIKDTFNVSDYSIRQAQKLVKERGFLAEPEPKHGKQLQTETISLVRSYYENHENSRVLPGMKDVVTVGKK